ncbi:MAG: electron transfer flavoprotein subunit alpha/FixB family protein [Fidelibacterota bacterium]
MSIIVILENQNGSLHRISEEALVAAQHLGQDLNMEVKAVALGSDNDAVTQKAAACDLNEILSVTHETLATYTGDAWTAALAQVVEKEKPTYLLMGHSYQVRDYGPRLSVCLQCPFIADASGFTLQDGKPVFQRTTFNGKLVANIAAGETDCVMVSFQSAAYQADDIVPGTAAIHAVDIQFDADSITTIPEAPFQEAADSVDLTAADIIVSVGRGIGKEENISVAQSLADALHGELGSSRPVVDAGWLPQSRQVGSSGQSVSPKLYFALGISGAIQHLVGMKGSKFIIAVNKDPDAPIFDVADVGVVGDLMDIVPKLTEALQT